MLHPDPHDWHEPVSNTDPPDVDPDPSKLHELLSNSEPDPPSDSLRSALEVADDRTVPPSDDDTSLGISSNPQVSPHGFHLWALRQSLLIVWVHPAPLLCQRIRFVISVYS